MARNDRTGTLSLILAVAVGSAASHLCTSAMPLQIGALVEGFQLSASDAGLVGFFQVASLAVCMIVFTHFAHRFSPFPVGLLGLAIGIAANVAIYFAPPALPALCLLGAVSGVGYGLVLATAVAAAADHPKPDQIYAGGNSGSVLLMVGLLALLPLVSSLAGARATFLGIAFILLIASPFLAGFRKRQAKAETVHLPKVRIDGGLALIVIWCLFSFGTGAIWTFAERIGNSIGLKPETIGLVLSSSVFVGLAGTGVAALLANRMSRIWMLVLGLAGSGTCCLFLANATELWSFTAAAMLYWVFTMYVYIVLLGAAAILDPGGRLGTLGTGCERLAFAVGAPIGGLLVDLGSYFWIGIITAATRFVSIPLCLPPLKKAFNKRAAAVAFPAGNVGAGAITAL